MTITRRSFLSQLTLASVGIASASYATVTPKIKPNIVFVLCDDLGYGDVHACNPKHGKIKTPHIDALAYSGIHATEMHSNSAVCTPTRYGLLTGRYAWRTRLQHWVLRGYGKPLITRDRLTVATFLKNDGYDTACIGKWHLGMGMQPMPKGHPHPATQVNKTIAYDLPFTDSPIDHGFNTFYGLAGSLDMTPFVWVENDRFVEVPTARKKWISDGDAMASFEADQVMSTILAKTQTYLRKKHDKPFFLYLPFAAPHLPHVPSAKWKGKSGISLYADYVMELDDAVGQMRATLKEQGLEQNTLFVFSSDNGCCRGVNFKRLETQFGHYPSAGRRGYKASIWDGGHRVPFIASWPGHIRPNTTCDQLMCLTDFFATVSDILQKPLAPEAAVDSFSLLPALLGKKDEVRETIVHHSVDGSFSIRTTEWKLCLCPGAGTSFGANRTKPSKQSGEQLYHLTESLDEKKNVIKQHPEVVKTLKDALRKIILDGRSTPGPIQKNDVPVQCYLL